MNGTARLTMLNDMAGGEFSAALDRLVDWGIRDLDLRGDIMGYSINQLPLEIAKAAMREIESRQLTVYSMSTGLLVGEIDRGQNVARAEVDAILERVLPAAEILKPKYIRLLAGQWKARPAAPTAIRKLLATHPWVPEEYRRAAEAISAAGWTPILENEATKCFLAHPDEMVEFLEAVNHPSLRFTWDVENQWATGTYPTLKHLDQLAPYISFYHVKGAKAGADDYKAEWNVSLEDSTWPVAEITQAVVDRGLSEVICLNPSQHGRDIPGYDYGGVPASDLNYLRRHIRGIE